MNNLDQQTLSEFVRSHINPTAHIEVEDLPAIRSALVEYLIVKEYGPPDQVPHIRPHRWYTALGFLNFCDMERIVDWAIEQGALDSIEHWQSESYLRDRAFRVESEAIGRIVPGYIFTAYVPLTISPIPDAMRAFAGRDIISPGLHQSPRDPNENLQRIWMTSPSLD